MLIEMLADYFSFENRVTRLLNDYFKWREITTDAGKPPLITVWGNRQLFDIHIYYEEIMTDKRMYEELEQLKELFRIDNIKLEEVSINNGYCQIRFSNRKQLREFILDSEGGDNYRPIELTAYELLFGYDTNNRPIVANMKELPHVLIVGLAGSGKSSMLNYLLQNLKGAYIILCNAYESDFKGIKANEVVMGEEDIITCLEMIIEGAMTIEMIDKPIYIVIEEMATLKDKKLLELINRLLCVGRHVGQGVYIIGVCQESLKENFKYKSLFTNRIAFRQIDSYKAVLGRESDEILKQREFLYLGNELIKGHTYTLKNRL